MKQLMNLAALLVIAAAAAGQAPSSKPAASERNLHDIDAEGYVASGWMGDGEQEGGTIHDSASKENPHTAPTCHRWEYKPGAKGWIAVAWQFPANNWGDVRGKNLGGKGFTKLVFWARGEPDGAGRLPRLQFKAGGGTDPSKTYMASFAVERPAVQLGREWGRYEIDLTGQDLSNVPCAFVWAASKEDNPEGVKFYLDDINFE